MNATALDTCKSYFAYNIPLSTLSNFSQNKVEKNALAILHIFSYYTLFIPLIMGIA